MKNTYLAALVTLSASTHLSGCTTGSSEDFNFSKWQAQLSNSENSCLLETVNSCLQDYDYFNDELAWDARAASALIKQRNGDDELCGTVDDLSFAQLGEIDEIPYVGPVALGNLLQGAWDAGCVDSPCNKPDRLINGVYYTYNQEKNVLDWANHAGATDMLAINGIGPVTVQTLIEFRLQHGKVDDLEKLAVLKGVGPKRLATLKHDVPALWCTQPDAHCACSPEVEAQIRNILGNVKSLIDQPNDSAITRFVTLLGSEGYLRYRQYVLQALGASLWNVPPSGTTPPSPFDQVATFFSDTAFLNPFTHIAPTQVSGDTAISASNAAVDAAIMHLNTLDLESTDIGASFIGLATGGNEAAYLAEVNAWRTLDSSLVLTTELPHLWLFHGPLAGIQCEISVSRKTGAVLEVDLQIP